MRPVLLGLLAGCAEATGSGLVDGLDSRSRIAEDGFPVYDCSMPPDEAVIFVMPATDAILYYSMDSFEIVTFDALASIPPLHELITHTAIGGGPENLRYTSVLWGYLSAWGLSHPTDAQGEQHSEPDSPYGMNPWHKISGRLAWGEPWMDYPNVITGEGTNYHPTQLCLSRIRHQRVAGVFTHWTEMENYSETWDVEFPVSFVFDIQHSRAGEPWLNVHHRYAEPSMEQRNIRDLGVVYASYSDDSPPEVVWSLDSLPKDDG